MSISGKTYALAGEGSKQVLRDGQHFADAIDADAALAIVQAMNRRPTLRPNYQDVAATTGSPAYTRG